MINRAELKNFGPIEKLDWQNLGKINLVIGNNGCGKSFVLKALYSAVRTLEDYKRGETLETDSEILANKLHWTFQAEKIGDLVNKTAESPLSFKFIFDNNVFDYSFGKDTTKAITLDNRVPPRADNSIYLPAKEVLSLFQIILASRENKKSFGFDDTYVDLAKALVHQYLGQVDILISQFAGIGLSKEHLGLLKDSIESDSEKYKELKEIIDQRLKLIEKNHPKLDIQKTEVFNECQQQLDTMLGGKIEYDYETKRWQFKQGNQQFSVGVMAEGIKKIAILDTLLDNGYLTENSIVFIDEPEANLHPQAIAQLLDIIAMLANHGIQFFLASHSYFVIKKLFLIAQEQQISIPVLSYQNNEWGQSDLLDEMPDNAIINESIRLYKEEVDLAFK